MLRWWSFWSKFSSRWASRVLWTGGWLLAGLAIVISVSFLGLRYWALPNIDEWRPNLAAQLAKLLEQPVSIVSMDAVLVGWQPQLRVQGLKVGESTAEPGPWLDVGSAMARLSWRTLLEGGPRFSALEIDQVQVRIERDKSGQWWVAGKRMEQSKSQDDRWLRDLLQQRNVQARSVNVVVRDHTQEIAGGAQISVGVDQWRAHGIGRTWRSTGQIGSLNIGTKPMVLAPIEVMLDAVREPRLPVGQVTSWRGEAYAAAGNIDLAPLNAFEQARVLGDAPQGSVSLALWSKFAQGQWSDARVKASARQLKLPHVERGAFDVDVKLDPVEPKVRGEMQRIKLVAHRANADLGRERTLELNAGAQMVWSAKRGVESFQAQSPKIELGPWAEWAKTLPLPDDALGRWLRVAQLQGRVSELKIDADRSDEPRLAASARFAGLKVDHGQHPTWPSVQGLDGQVELTQADGSLMLEGNKTRLRLPSVFEDPEVALDTLAAKLRWKRVAGDSTKPHWQVMLDKVEFANVDTAGGVSGQYSTAQQGPGLVDLKGQLSRANALAIARYLPLRMNPMVRSWVKQSILGGSADDVRFELAGDLYEFPFHDDMPGRFKLQARLKDATLKYSPDFPEITAMDSVLKFDRDTVDISVRSGKIFGVELKDSRARIADVRTPLLVVEGNGTGPAQDMIRFVNQSPVATRIDDFTAETKATGDAQLQLSLSVPLANIANTSVRGAVFFIDNTIKLDNVLPPFGGVTGRLEFSDQGLRLRDIGAQFLGGPIKVQGQTPGPGMFDLQASGTITADGIRSQMDNPLTRELFGQTQYQARIDVRKRQAKVSITSDLTGLGSRLPAPFGKSVEMTWPLRVSSAPIVASAGNDETQRSLGDLISVRIRDDIQVEVERKRDPKTERMLIKRAAFGLDLPAQLPDSGFAVAVRNPKVDLDAWSPYLIPDTTKESGDQPNPDFAPDFSLLPSQITAVADEVMVAGKKLNGVVFGATRVGGFWRANVASRQINGFFNWREAGPGQRVGSIQARFARLEIPADEASEIESLIDQSPATLPSINLMAEEFIVGGKAMGELRLIATNAGTPSRPVWRLDELILQQPSATLRASGQWALPSGQLNRRTALSIDLELRDSGALLDAMGFPNTLKNGAGSIVGQLGWNGAPTSLDYGSLSGQFKMELGKGQFLKTDPGLAKLIGVLNLQSLQRRLTLDFSDLFGEGFAFEEIKSDVRVESGIAKSADTTMRSPVAKVSINGAVDLARETQQLRVQVQPEINAGLASLGYAALVNPAIGLGTLAAQALLRRPLQELFTNEYEISGSWVSPTVRELTRRERAKE